MDNRYKITTLSVREWTYFKLNLQQLRNNSNQSWVIAFETQKLVDLDFCLLIRRAIGVLFAAANGYYLSMLYYAAPLCRCCCWSL